MNAFEHEAHPEESFAAAEALFLRAQGKDKNLITNEWNRSKRMLGDEGVPEPSKDQIRNKLIERLRDEEPLRSLWEETYK